MAVGNAVRLEPPAHRHARIVILGPELVQARLAGADSFGGPLRLETPVVERIRSLGWLMPKDSGYQGVSARTRRARSGESFYYYGSPATDADRIAGLITTGLELLGADIGEIDAVARDHAHRPG